MFKVSPIAFILLKEIFTDFETLQFRIPKS